MSIVSTNNRLLYVNGGSFTGVQTDGTLTGNGTNAYPLGVNESALNPSEAEIYVQANSGVLNEVSDVVQSNSAQWGQGTGATGAYVPLSAGECTIGSHNSASNNSLAQGHRNSANGNSLAQGTENSAITNSLAQGNGNTAYRESFAQGQESSATVYSFAQGIEGNSAYYASFAQGQSNIAKKDSLAQGIGNSAENYSIAQGNYNSAFQYSQAFGNRTKAENNGMAIGVCNNITSAAFVIGNGTSDSARSDCFVIDHSGNVSSCGDIQSSGISLLALYNAFTAYTATH